MSLQGLKQYQSTSTQSGTFDASPHRLIQMLMEGALEKIAMAKGFMMRDEVEKKGHHISWAIKIIGGLQNSLNKDAGGELAQNLDNLYDYMCEKLFEANIENSVEKLDEVSNLMVTVKEGWDGIENEVKQSTQPQVRSQSA